MCDRVWIREEIVSAGGTLTQCQWSCVLPYSRVLYSIKETCWAASSPQVRLVWHSTQGSGCTCELFSSQSKRQLCPYVTFRISEWETKWYSHNTHKTTDNIKYDWLPTK